jgi:hypothetical protein
VHRQPDWTAIFGRSAKIVITFVGVAIVVAIIGKALRASPVVLGVIGGAIVFVGTLTMCIRYGLEMRRDLWPQGRPRSRRRRPPGASS